MKVIIDTEKGQFLVLPNELNPNIEISWLHANILNENVLNPRQFLLPLVLLNLYFYLLYRILQPLLNLNALLRPVIFHNTLCWIQLILVFVQLLVYRWRSFIIFILIFHSQYLLYCLLKWSLLIRQFDYCVMVLWTTQIVSY